MDANIIPTVLFRFSECFDEIRDLLCHYQCSADQSKLISEIVTDSHGDKVLEMTARVPTKVAEDIFNVCEKVRLFIFWRMVDQVCINKPCDAKEFIRSIATQKSRGGQCPFQINIKFT